MSGFLLMAAAIMVYNLIIYRDKSKVRLAERKVLGRAKRSSGGCESPLRERKQRGSCCDPRLFRHVF